MKKIFLLSPLLTSLLFNPYISLSQNVGIGTPTPAYKLDVKTGSINTDSSYRINSFRVLAITDPSNVFIGREAGLVTLGGYNTFAGHADTDWKYSCFH